MRVPSFRILSGAAAVLLLLAMATDALAQTTPNPNTNATLVAIEQILSVFNNQILKLWSNPLRTAGLKLLVALTAIVWMWAMFKSMFMRASLVSLMGETMSIFVQMGIVGAIFGAWGGPSWAGIAVQSVIGLSSAIGGGAVIDVMATTKGGPELMILRQAMEGAFMVIDIAQGATYSQWWEVLGYAANVIIVVIAKILIALILILAGCIAMGTLLLAKIGIGLAMALAPVLVPWIMFAPAQSFFAAWLGFLLSGAFTILILQIFTAMMIQFTGEVGKVAAAASSFTGDFGAYGAMLLISILLVFLMHRAGDWARALVPGGFAASIGGFLAPVSGAARMGSESVKTASKTTKSADRIAGAASNAVASTWAAGKQAVAHAKRGYAYGATGMVQKPVAPMQNKDRAATASGKLKGLAQTYGPKAGANFMSGVGQGFGAMQRKNRGQR